MAAVTLLVVFTLAAALLWALPGDSRHRLVRLFPDRFRSAPAVTGRLVRAAPVPSLRSALARRSAGEARRRAVILLCRVMAAELRAGQPPETALRVAALEAGPMVGEVSDAASLRRVAERDEDLWALVYLAACWEVAAETGAGLAGVVDALAVSLTEREEQRAEVSARAAGPRTTALVLVGLPVVGVAMSAALGGSPLVFLFTTPLGLLCLVLGVLLDVLGAWWTLRMVRGAVS
ncbi:type II secretion system F family protein [Nocardiopsis valliformis]|uniref:type II secretion system F family protein n=1 Tax=Nocardiopsis valliformis TaxID=239974 RepID=UPI00047757F4|nr:type II secretion system F family protein [Nocardiopsis valliformis]